MNMDKGFNPCFFGSGVLSSVFSVVLLPYLFVSILVFLEVGF